MCVIVCFCLVSLLGFLICAPCCLMRCPVLFSNLLRKCYHCGTFLVLCPTLPSYCAFLVCFPNCVLSQFVSLICIPRSLPFSICILECILQFSLQVCEFVVFRLYPDLFFEFDLWPCFSVWVSVFRS